MLLHLVLLECQDLVDILLQVKLCLSPLVRGVLLLMSCISRVPLDEFSLRLGQGRFAPIVQVLRVDNCVVLGILISLINIIRNR